MKSFISGKFLIVFIILAPIVIDFGCKKQPKCGCGKDVIIPMVDVPSIVYYDVETKYASFQPQIGTPGASYIFCSPGRWIDTLVLKNYPSGTSLLLTGNTFYDCTYLMNSGNYGYYVPPVYVVEVTSLKEDNYGKK
jgi:hypothetical protein